MVEAVERVPLERFEVNERGTGSAQYHPRMMLALLVYCYANGIFGSRRIERATYRDIGVRYVAANCHPDHDTICTFRRSNFDAVAAAFLQVLLLAKELQLLRVGTVSVDGTKVDANANKRNSLGYDRAGALREQLRGEIEGLLDQAEHADTDDAPDPQGLPEELSRRETLRAKLDRACAELERRAQARADSERAEYERTVAARERRTGSRKGRHITPPTTAPEAKAQINLTDADSALMRKSRRHEYRQAYNAQAAVDADGSQLVLGARVSVCASDRNELVADVDAIPAGVGRGGSSLGRQRLRDGQRGVATGRARHGGVGGDGGGRPTAPARLPTGAAGADGEGAAGGLDQVDAAEDGTARAPGALPFAQADGGAGVRDREAGDGLPAVSAAGSREGGGRMGLGNAGV